MLRWNSVAIVSIAPHERLSITGPADAANLVMSEMSRLSG